MRPVLVLCFDGKIVFSGRHVPSVSLDLPGAVTFVVVVAVSRLGPRCRTGRHPRRVDHRQLSDTQRTRGRPASDAFSCPGPQFLSACVPVKSCTLPSHGRIIQPEDVPYGGFGSRFEVDDRRILGFCVSCRSAPSLRRTKHISATTSFPCRVNLFLFFFLRVFVRATCATVSQPNGQNKKITDKLRARVVLSVRCLIHVSLSRFVSSCRASRCWCGGDIASVSCRW